MATWNTLLPVEVDFKTWNSARWYVSKGTFIVRLPGERLGHGDSAVKAFIKAHREPVRNWKQYISIAQVSPPPGFSLGPVDRKRALLDAFIALGSEVEVILDGYDGVDRLVTLPYPVADFETALKMRGNAAVASRFVEALVEQVAAANEIDPADHPRLWNVVDTHVELMMDSADLARKVAALVDDAHLARARDDLSLFFSHLQAALSLVVPYAGGVQYVDRWFSIMSPHVSDFIEDIILL